MTLEEDPERFVTDLDAAIPSPACFVCLDGEGDIEITDCDGSVFLSRTGARQLLEWLKAREAEGNL